MFVTLMKYLKNGNKYVDVKGVIRDEEIIELNNVE